MSQLEWLESLCVSFAWHAFALSIGLILSFNYELDAWTWYMLCELISCHAILSIAWLMSRPIILHVVYAFPFHWSSSKARAGGESYFSEWDEQSGFHFQERWNSKRLKKFVPKVASIGPPMAKEKKPSAKVPKHVQYAKSFVITSKASSKNTSKLIKAPDADGIYQSKRCKYTLDTYIWISHILLNYNWYIHHFQEFSYWKARKFLLGVEVSFFRKPNSQACLRPMMVMKSNWYRKLKVIVVRAALAMT